MPKKVKKLQTRAKFSKPKPKHQNQNFLGLTPGKPPVPTDINLNSLKFVFPQGRGYKFQLDVVNACTDASIDRTIEGASTLSITLSDEESDLITSGVLDTDKDGVIAPIDCKVDDNWYRLANVSLDSGSITLQFEDRTVWKLRQFDEYKSWKRTEKFTRAMAVKAMCAEANVKTFIPELKTPQPIKKAGRSKRDSGDSTGSHRAGIASLNQSFKNSDFTMSSTAVRRVLELCGFTPREAWIMDKISDHESNRKPGVENTLGDGGIGLLQPTPFLLLQGGRANWGPAAMDFLKKLGGPSALYNPFANGLMARYLFEDSGYGPWSASGTADIVAAAPAEVRSALTEADRRWKQSGGLSKLDGKGGNGKVTVTSVKKKPYKFSRGEKGGKRETSWDAIQRLASEVGWRAFVVKDTLVFMAEDDPSKGETDLIQGAVYHTIEGAKDERLLTYSGEADVGKKASEFSFQYLAQRWAFTPGMVVRLQKFGSVYNGRWLVSTVSRNMFNQQADVTLKRASPSKAEPANETETTSKTSTGRGSGSGNVQSPFGGDRKYPISGAYGTNRGTHIHAGIDVGVPCGTPCIAPFNGKITHVSTSGFGTAGGMIHLEAQDDVPGTAIKAGEKVGWGHISKSIFAVGKSVKAGQRIATSGGSPCHVHFIYIKSGGGGNGIDGNADPTGVLRQLGGI